MKAFISRCWIQSVWFISVIGLASIIVFAIWHQEPQAERLDSATNIVEQGQSDKPSAKVPAQASNNKPTSVQQPQPAQSQIPVKTPVKTPATTRPAKQKPVSVSKQRVLSTPADTYPAKWRNAPRKSIVDTWGNWNRECTSYVAWKVTRSGKSMPIVYADAKQWIIIASSIGLTVAKKPSVGSVGISTKGTYGHAVYVEKVLDNGTVQVSQYNASGTGKYSVATVATNSYTYINF